jgi:formate-dependent nitrite reductase cytochrome c552 subunit
MRVLGNLWLGVWGFCRSAGLAKDCQNARTDMVKSDSNRFSSPFDQTDHKCECHSQSLNNLKHVVND